MKPGLQAQQGNRPWLALLAAACLLLAIPAGRCAAIRFSPAEDLSGYGGVAAGLAGIGITLLAGVLLGILSLLRRESPRTLSLVTLVAAGVASVWVLWHMPG